MIRILIIKKYKKVDGLVGRAVDSDPQSFSLLDRDLGVENLRIKQKNARKLVEIVISL